jgi:hypothetical protein
MPTAFLPTVVDEKAKKGKGKGKTPPSTSNNQPEFVGPRGQQIPK